MMRWTTEVFQDGRKLTGWLGLFCMNLKGLCVTNTQAEELKSLYSNLLSYDKKPITFQPRQIKRTRGRFARSKNRVGHVGIDAMKR